MTDNDQILLWLGAFRYYTGRMTYAVSEFCELLIAKWETLPRGLHALIQRDLEEEFRRDDEMRKPRGLTCQTSFPLGMDCDRAEWEKVRALWNKDSHES